MREVGLPGLAVDLHVASFRASLATILELPLEALPELRAEEDPATGWIVSRWLGGLGLGLARVADPGSFAGPGRGWRVFGRRAGVCGSSSCMGYRRGLSGIRAVTVLSRALGSRTDSSLPRRTSCG